MEQALQDARAISILAMGCYLVYGYLLADHATNGEQTKIHVLTALDRRLGSETVRRHMLECPIAKVLDRIDPGVLRQNAFDDAGFIQRMQQHFQASVSSADLVQRSRDEICKRENDLKSIRARLGSGRIQLDDREIAYYETWKSQDWGWTDYRWGIARTFLNELLGRDDGADA